VRESLRGLYARRSLAEPGRLKLSCAALARIYLRGRLYAKAAGELRGLLARETQRPDLSLALAEALWREGQTDDAAMACQQVLRVLPNCLKANLILGQIWLHTRQEDPARVLLQRAQALDPDNGVAQRLLGAQSPLPPRTTRLPFAGEALPPPDLPYLLAEDEEAAPRALPARATGAEQATHVAAAAREMEARHRLSLARRYSGAGQIERALEQYAGLVEPDSALLAQVLADLEALAERLPGRADLGALLAAARELAPR
jgi:tetratricopeptide (TPR) repeat protein